MRIVLAIASLVTALAYVGVAFNNGPTRFATWTDAKGNKRTGGGWYFVVAFLFVAVGSMWAFGHR